MREITDALPLIQSVLDDNSLPRDQHDALTKAADIIATQGGVAAIAAERQRQIEKEGWTPEHDDQHTDESLAIVAALYAAPFALFAMEQGEGWVEFNDPWPSEWDDAWDRREDFDRRRRLVVSGALIAADIDRIDRAAASNTTTE